jgi:hypothetical protein
VLGAGTAKRLSIFGRTSVEPVLGVTKRSANGNAPGAWWLRAAFAIRRFGEHGEPSNDVWVEGKGLPIFQSCGHRS